MSDSKPTTKRAVDAAAVRQEKFTRPGPGEQCPECGVLYRFCEECHAWGCKCGDPVSVCQSCHQATCGNCGTPYGFVDAYRAESEPAAPPPLREIAEVLAYADPSGTSNYGPLKVVEQWLSGFEPEPEPGEEVVGSVEQVVLERLHPGGLGVALDAIVDVARAVDELAKRVEEEWDAQARRHLGIDDPLEESDDSFVVTDADLDKMRAMINEELVKSRQAADRVVDRVIDDMERQGEEWDAGTKRVRKLYEGRSEGGAR